MATADEVLGKLTEFDAKYATSFDEVKSAIADIQKKQAFAHSVPQMDEDVKGMIDYFAGRTREFKAVAAGTTATVAAPTQGGYLAPTLWDDKVSRKMFDDTPLLSEIDVLNIKAPVVGVAVETSLPGANWVGEIDARTSVTPGMGYKNLTIRQLTCKVPVSRLLLDTSNIENAESYIIERATKSMGIALGDAIINGSGSNQPSGILGDSGLVTQKSGKASALDTKNIIDLIGAIPNDAEPNAKFYMSRQTWAEVLKTFGTDSAFVGLGIKEGVGRSFFGYPVVLCGGMPAVASNNVPILFGDMKSAYKGAVVGGTEFLRDEYSDATNGVVNIHFYKNFGGSLVQPSALVGLKIGTSS